MALNVKPARNIKSSTQNMLWGIAAGRCEFSGCNKPLWRNEVTNIQVNIAQKAHIWSFSDDGPRGNQGIKPSDINNIDNLMLVCHGCHKLIDDDNEGGIFSAELLLGMKRAHEKRIELVTSINQNKQSHILLYGANIGQHGTNLNYSSVATAMLPEYYPANKTPIEISLKNSSFQDNEEFYWVVESHNLEKAFDERVLPGLQSGDILHLSIFALAPQPLLIKLGSLLTDIPEAKLFQRHREPQTWEWQNDSFNLGLKIIPPNRKAKNIALTLSLSASISHDRIYETLGEDTAIWTLTTDSPDRDLIKSHKQLKKLRETLRTLFDQIKVVSGNDALLHVFPAVPVTVAIEFGRVHMPKADIRLRIYDQNRKSNGFMKAIEVG